MIPQSSIDYWRSKSPWSSDLQVEQDLVLSRAVVEIFADDELRELVAMRGGTVLNKFHFAGGSRYSEDIDLVKVLAGKGGPLLDAIRKKLDPWLGVPKREIKERGMNLVYRFKSEAEQIPMRLKIEINTVEQFSVMGYSDIPFEVDSSWFAGQAVVKTFSLEELMGTKVRALYQRKKGRDLFDLWYALEFCSCNPEGTVECFLEYMSRGGFKVRRSEYDLNLQNKETDKVFIEDIRALLRPGIDYEIGPAFKIVRERIISLLPE